MVYNMSNEKLTNAAPPPLHPPHTPKAKGGRAKL